MSGAHLHELETHSDHLRRIFELVLSSPLLPRFKELLLSEEHQNPQIDSVKSCILRCICLLAIGTEIFPDNSDIKTRLVMMIGNTDFYSVVFNQTRSSFSDTMNMAFMAIGYYLKNGFDVVPALARVDNFQYIFAAVFEN